MSHINKILIHAIENGILDMDTIQKEIEMNERRKYLEMHPYKIWEGKDGKWYTYIPDKEKGRRLVKRVKLDSVKEVVISYWRIEEENPTIDEVFKEWNDRKLELKKISPATHNRNKQFYDRHYSEFGKNRIKNIEWEDFEDFLEEQVPKYDLTAKAFSGLKGVTKGFLQRAKKRKLIDFNVVTKLNELDVTEVDFKHIIKEDSQEVYDEKEFAKMMEYLEQNLDIHNMGILLLFVTGMRIGELVTLKHSDFEGNTIKIRRTETRFPKDGKWHYEVKEFPKTKAGVRTVIVPDDYSWLIKKLLHRNPFGEFVFVNNKGERMTINCFRKRLQCINQKLNIVQKSPHKIRKTYGSILLDNKVDKNLVTSVMGHTTILCTENHYHRNRKSIALKTQIISSIPEFKAQQKR